MRGAARRSIRSPRRRAAASMKACPDHLTTAVLILALTINGFQDANPVDLAVNVPPGPGSDYFWLHVRALASDGNQKEKNDGIRPTPSRVWVLCRFTQKKNGPLPHFHTLCVACLSLRGASSSVSTQPDRPRNVHGDHEPEFAQVPYPTRRQ